MSFELRQVRKSYGKNDVLRGVDFECPSGTITGLLGPNGSGLSTTLRILAGLTRAQSGTALIDNEPIESIENPGMSLGVLLEAVAHHPSRSVYETIRIPSLMIGLSRSHVDNLIHEMDLTTLRKRRFGSLSLAMKQRVSLAIALLGEPRHLILDEPVSGLEIENIPWLRSLLFDFAHQQGGTVLLSGHLLQELQPFVDRVVIMSRGVVVATRDRNDAAPADQCRVLSENQEALLIGLLVRGFEARREDSTSWVRVNAETETVTGVARELDILVIEIEKKKVDSLEQLYLSVTSGEDALKGSDGLKR